VILNFRFSIFDFPGNGKRRGNFISSAAPQSKITNLKSKIQ